MWIALSLGAMGLLATMLLLIVPPGRAGVQASVILFYVFAAGALFNFVYLKYQGTSLRLSGPRQCGLDWPHWQASAATCATSRQCILRPIRAIRPPSRDARCWQ